MLWQLIEHTTRRALQIGALQPMPTTQERVWDEGVNFLVRVVEQLRTKRQANRTRGDATGQGRGRAGETNPFLPHEPALFVAGASPSHVCLLNKYPVVDHHLLIVTRDFRPQQLPLDESDFEALWNCLRQYPSLGFYNGGQAAGASQRHKHLQLVPLPLTDGESDLPIEPLLVPPSAGATNDGLQVSLPFPHAFVRLDDTAEIERELSDAEPTVKEPSVKGPTGWEAADTLARTMPWRMLRAYRQLLAAVGLRAGPDNYLPPYNLLVTRQWMLLVPRTVECCDSISVNALGFAGALLVRDAAERDRLKALGPMRILRHVTGASAV